ncbi:MAG: hypothetical protein DHS20C15_27340 [Planctomycetota bacterium]|nr:MAG: hypothetical protein DHS20C15_27340 [Planctomycetota bacterium]
MNRLLNAAWLAVSLLTLTTAAGAQASADTSGADAAQLDAIASVVILVRHAETDPAGGADPGLSAQGSARAAALVSAFADAGIERVVTSSLQRTRDTGAPVAEHFGLTPVAVSTSLPGGLDAHLAAVVQAVREAQPARCALVVGHSNTVPRLVSALGGPDLPDIAHDDYGNVFVLLTAADGEVRLIRSRQVEPNASAASSAAYDVRDPVPDAEFPEQASSAYVLPYPVGARHNVRQGNGNPTNTHNAKYNSTFAYDFEMPIGSEIVAARGGRVLAVVEQFSDEQHGLADGNYLAIDHGDGSFALYGHLTQNGALVEVGEQVKAGQLIAHSGNSGLSQAPHLHFVVSQCPEGAPLGGPNCTSIPISFRNTRAHPRGLIGSPTSEIGGGEWYEALEG